MKATLAIKGPLLITIVVLAMVSLDHVVAQTHAGEPTPVPADRHGDPLPEGAVGRLGTARFRHDGDAICVAFAEQGKTLVVKTSLGFELLDAATGIKRKGLNRLPLGFSYLVSGGKVSPDGSQFTSTGPILANVENYIAVSPDGNVLAIPEKAVANKEIIIGFWDLAANKRTHTAAIPVQDDPNGPPVVAINAVHIQYLTFGADGKILAMAYSKGRQAGMATLFNGDTGKTLITFGNEEGPFTFLGFAPDGKTIAALPGNNEISELQIRDTATGKIIHRLLRDSIRGDLRPIKDFIAFSPDSKMLAARNGKNRFCVFDLATGKELSKLNGVAPRASRFFGLRFTRDGKQLLSCDSFGTVRCWDLSTREIVQKLEAAGASSEPYALAGFAFAPDAKSIAFAYTWARSIRIWDLTTERELFTNFQGQDDRITQMSFLPKGNSLVSVGSLGKAYLWDIHNKEQKAMLPGRHTALFFSRDGRQFATILGGRVQVQTIGEKKKSLAIALPENAFAEAAIFSSDGRKLLTLDSQDGATRKKGLKQPIFVGKVTPIKRFIRSWDLATGQEEAVWQIPNQSKAAGLPQTSPALSFDGKAVFMETGATPVKKAIRARSRSSGVDVYFPASGASRSLRGRDNEAGESFMPSPDARLVASAFYSPMMNRPIAPYDMPIKNVSYGIRLFEVVTGTEILVLQHQHDFVRQLAWSQDGRMLACPDKTPTNDSEGGIGSPFRILVWDSASGKLIGRFDGIAAEITALAFSRDAKYLAAALGDTSILLYDLSRIDPKAHSAAKLAKPVLEACWADLAGANTQLAYQAIGALVRAPKESVPFLQAHLKPASAVDSAKVEKWVADLNSDVFAVRQTATKELEGVGDQAIAHLQKQLLQNPSLETRLRLQQIFKAVGGIPDRDAVRAIRAVMILERIGSPEAKAVLETLARGAPGARATEEAKASLERLNQRLLPQGSDEAAANSQGH